MKKLTRTMKCVAWMLSLCLLFGINVVAKAEAQYQPNVTYVNPAINSKDEYYSVTKMRMETYSDTTFEVVYPKDATLEVTTNKPKKLQAMVTETVNENPTYNLGKKVYVTPQEVHYTYYYFDAKEGYTRSYDTKTGYGSLSYDKTTNTFYYYDNSYDVTTGKWVNTKVTVVPDRNKFKCAIYTDEYDNTYYFNGTNYDSDYGYWYYGYDEDNDEYRDTYGYLLNKDTTGYYIYDGLGRTYKSNQAETYDDGSRYEYATATIRLDSTKQGTYKVNVIVNGVKTTMKVYVTPYGNNVYSKMKLGNDTINSIKINSSAKNYSYESVENYKVKSSLKSAKLKLTANKGFKINGFVVASVNEDGDTTMKAYKNGKTIKLSQGYAEASHDASSNSKYKKAKKETYVCVSYTDKYTKTSVKYSVVKKHGVKQIKCVTKASDGKKYISYYDYGDVGFALWSY